MHEQHAQWHGCTCKFCLEKQTPVAHAPVVLSVTCLPCVCGAGLDPKQVIHFRTATVRFWMLGMQQPDGPSQCGPQGACEEDLR